MRTPTYSTYMYIDCTPLYFAHPKVWSKYSQESSESIAMLTPEKANPPHVDIVGGNVVLPFRVLFSPPTALMSGVRGHTPAPTCVCVVLSRRATIALVYCSRTFCGSETQPRCPIPCPRSLQSCSLDAHSVLGLAARCRAALARQWPACCCLGRSHTTITMTHLIYLLGASVIWGICPDLSGERADKSAIYQEDQ
jgi:hypothetical protein